MARVFFRQLPTTVVLVIALGLFITAMFNPDVNRTLTETHATR